MAGGFTADINKGHYQSPSEHTQLIDKLTLDSANQIADGVISAIKKNGFAHVTVYVVNEHGHTLVMKMMDECSTAGIPEIA